MTEEEEIVGRATVTTTDDADTHSMVSTDVTTTPKLHLRRKTKPQPGDRRFGQSSVTNGRRMHLDPAAGDTAWSRRGRDIYNRLIDDIGVDIDEAQLQQVRRCATLALECERFECQIAAGNAVDLATYALLGDTYARAAQCLYDLMISTHRGQQ